MLLRVRVTLPDRPGALGQVARTLGVAGADIVQVVVLERLGGRAVDDFTVVGPELPRERPAGRPGRDPRRAGGRVWKAIGAPVSGGHDAELLAQVAANPADGLATLVDAVPGLLAADWAAAAIVPADGHRCRPSHHCATARDRTDGGRRAARAAGKRADHRVRELGALRTAAPARDHPAARAPR